jgi:hypothetical protein
LGEQLVGLLRHAVQLGFKVSTYPSWQSMPRCEKAVSGCARLDSQY